MNDDSVEEDAGQAHAFLREGPGGGKGLPPRYDDGIRWLLNGYDRQVAASRVGLLVGWTGLWAGLWGAAFGAIVGPLFVLGALNSISPIQQYVHVGGGGAVNAVSLAAGVLIGAVGGFLVFAHFLVLNHPVQGIVSISSGWIIASLIVITTATYERSLLRFRGYRRLSRDEVRRVAPLVHDAADRLDLTALPRFAMADLLIPNAWTHMRTVVLTTSLLDTLDDDELTAVLAHELHHWQQGDAVGLRFVWAAAWPVAMLYNIGAILSGQSGNDRPGRARIRVPLLAFIGYLIAWPAWVIIKFVLVPIISRTQRGYEYEADAAAGDAGLAPAMISALTQLSAFEAGRTGWEQALAATHPPTKLRIEVLQESRDDDEDYQEEDLRRPRWREVRRLFNPWYKTSAEKDKAAASRARDGPNARRHARRPEEDATVGTNANSAGARRPPPRPTADSPPQSAGPRQPPGPPTPTAEPERPPPPRPPSDGDRQPQDWSTSPGVAGPPQLHRRPRPRP